MGPTNENTISADLSYTIPTSEKLNYLSVSLNSSQLIDLDVTRLNPVDDDPSLRD
jgi:hypothetical protein